MPDPNAPLFHVNPSPNSHNPQSINQKQNKELTTETQGHSN
jgi:hypothetical protein